MDILIGTETRTFRANLEGRPDALSPQQISTDTLDGFMDYLENGGQRHRPQITDATEESITLSTFNDAGIETHRTTVEVADSDDALELSARLAPYFGQEQ